ncbi:MAG: hypothetical protein AAF447_09910 [Myxococcota bacterium]
MELRRCIAARGPALLGLAALAFAAQASGQRPELWLLPRELRLEEPPHPVPPGAPHLVALPAPGARGHVLFLHGWRSCARAVLYAGPTRCARGLAAQPGMGLGTAHLAAESRTTLLVPQLAFRARDGSAGRFVRRGYAEALIDDVAPELGAARGLPVIVMAHSAGYEAALSVLHRGDLGTRVAAVVLFDALYGGTEAFLAWARAHPAGELISVHGRGRTERESRRLRTRARAAGLPVATALAGEARVRTIATTAAHGDVPAAHLASMLRHLAASGRLAAHGAGAPGDGSGAEGASSP